jgi:hypothetical protein
LLPSQTTAYRSVRLLHQANEEIISASAVLIASGLSLIPDEFHTVVARRSFIGLGAIIRCPLTHQQRQKLSMACGVDGYVGTAAVGSDLLEIAAAVSPKALSGANAPGELVRRLITSAGFEAPPGLDSVHWRGTPPLTRRVHPLAGHRCVLVGDAAGYVEPFTGEGIGWALQSAVEAAAFVHEQFDKWSAQALTIWHSRYEAALRRRQRRCRVVTTALRSGAIRSVAMLTLQRMPSLAAPLVHRLDKPIDSLNAKSMELIYGG